MKNWASIFLVSVLMAGAPGLRAQDASPAVSTLPSRPAQPDLPTTSTVMRTNSMAVLDDKKRLGPNDYVSFRVVGERNHSRPDWNVEPLTDFRQPSEVLFDVLAVPRESSLSQELSEHTSGVAQ